MREIYVYHPATSYHLIEIIETKNFFAYGTKLLTISIVGSSMSRSFLMHGLDYYSDEAGKEIIQFDLDELDKFESVNFKDKNRLIIEGIFS